MSSAPQPKASPLSRAALWYAANLGWRVFPLHTADALGCSCGSAECGAPGKHPRTPRGCLDASMDAETVAAWWQRWPDANVGVATGGGMIVLDVDPRHGGDDALVDAKRNNGALPDTIEALTGGGGRHIYLALPEGVTVRNSAGVIGAGLDVRGEGGYVVAAPSAHASGRTYEWEASSRPGEVPLAMVPPTWLAAMIARPKLRVIPGGVAAGEPIPAGSRNETLFRRAASMRVAGFERDAILAAVSVENETRCVPSVDPAEVKALVESVCRYAPGLSPEYEQTKAEADARRALAAERLDGERSLLAAVLTDTGRAHRTLDKVLAIVAPADLENPKHAVIFAGIVALSKRDLPIDASTVADELKSHGRIGAAGGAAYLAELVSGGGMQSLAEEHARRIAERSHLRACFAIVERARSSLLSDGAPMEVVGDARAVLATLPDGLRSGRDDSMRAHSNAAFEKIHHAMHNGRAMSLAKWGVPSLDGGPVYDADGGALPWNDGATGGLFDEKLYLLGGEAASGKTSLAWSAVLATARGDETTPGSPVLVFSLEMGGDELNSRLAGQMCEISEARLERGAFNEMEFHKLQRALSELAKLPIQIITDLTTAEDIEARVHAERARGDVGLVVIDYLQLLRMSRAFNDDNRADAERIQSLKRLAVKAKVPLLVITSMTKAGQKAAREGNVESDAARGSGLEYAADVIAFLLRSGPRTEATERDVVFHMTKRRGGPVTFPVLRFNAAKGTFTAPASAFVPVPVRGDAFPEVSGDDRDERYP